MSTDKETTPAPVKIEFVGEARLIFDAAVAANGAKVLRDFAEEIEDDTMVSMAESIARSYIARLAREEADEIQERARLLGPARGWELIAAERARQIEKGYTPEHDRHHDVEKLLDAAKAYLAHASPGGMWDHPLAYWPFTDGFNPGTREEALSKAGAMVAAALDRIAVAETAGEGQ